MSSGPFLSGPFFLWLSGWEARLYIILGIVGFVVLFALVMITVGLCERQYLVGDVEPTSEPFPFPPSAYWRETRETAKRLNLIFVGDFATRKGMSLIKGLQSLFLTEDKQVIVSINGAKRLKRTIMRTRLTSGRIIQSADNGGLSDSSKVMDCGILINAGIEELFEFHRQRVLRSPGAPVTFEVASALESYQKMDWERGERWVRMGKARWVDREQTSIRMTLRGAFGLVIDAFQQMNKLQDQKDRVKIKRAGSH